MLASDLNHTDSFMWEQPSCHTQQHGRMPSAHDFAVVQASEQAIPLPAMFLNLNTLLLFWKGLTLILDRRFQGTI